MQQFYDFFAKTFPHLFGFVGQAFPALTDAADFLRYIILIAGLVLAAIAVAVLVIGCFKVRFFRRLARILLIIEGLGAVGIGLIAANTIKTGDAAERTVKALEVGSPEVFDLIHGIFSGFGTDIVPSFIIIIVAFVVICVLLHLLILLSRMIVKNAEAKEQGADVPEVLPVEDGAQTAPEPAPAPAAEPAPVVATVVPAEEPIVPADVPEPEMETVIESDAAPAAADEPAAGSADEEVSDEDAAAAEEIAAAENAPVPDYPKLDDPVFMPIPSALFDTVDFTDPERDGFAANPGVYAPAAERLISDEATEDLTFIVYRKIEGKVVDLPIDALNANFKPYSYVDAKILRQKGLIPESAGDVKITAFGKLDKPLMVQASSFAPGVAKMIILAGGRPIEVQ